MQVQPSTHELAKKAMDLFHRNADTLIAGFLIRHPGIDPGDIVLVSQSTPDGFRFYVDAKELHVPPERANPEGYVPHSEGGQTCAMAYADGWNDCRQAIIDMAKAERGGDGEFAPIGGPHG